jgi:hypothetical protein
MVRVRQVRSKEHGNSRERNQHIERPDLKGAVDAACS